MTSPRASRGLLIALLAALSFGLSGAFVKPLLEAGWSPAAAVTVRALVGGLVLAPFGIRALRGRWSALWHARGRVLAMALVGVSGTQLAYFAAVQRLPVDTAILTEYMAPLLLVALAWLTTRRIPAPVVLIGSVLALVGLVLVVGVLGDAGSLHPDSLGLLFAAAAMFGNATYYLVAAAPSDDLPPVALAAAGLVIGGVALVVFGALVRLVDLQRFVPMTATYGTVHLFGGSVPWWLPLLVVGVISTGFAYAASITATELLGSRVASFFGLLEVIAAAVYAWLLLGERLTLLQIVGGALVLIGIGFVRSERRSQNDTEGGQDPIPPLEPGSATPDPLAPQTAALPTC